MTEAWVIYGLRDPRGGPIRYVGFSRCVGKRMRQHARDAARGFERPVHLWIRALTAEGVEFVHDVLEDGRGDGWRAAERKWVTQHRDTALNIGAGGNGAPNVSEAARESMRQKLRGRVFTPEWRQKISEAKKGQPRPDAVATCKKMAEGNRGKKMNLSPEERARRAMHARALRGTSWKNISEEERLRRSRATSEQMKRVWRERHAQRS